jgi:hypothetical protein
VDRPRCVQCRNPIKEHQAAVGEGDQRFHEDCWSDARPAVIAKQADQQRDYERRIASDGLAALLSPYVKVFPAQRSTDQRSTDQRSTDQRSTDQPAVAVSDAEQAHASA